MEPMRYVNSNGETDPSDPKESRREDLAELLRILEGIFRGVASSTIRLKEWCQGERLVIGCDERRFHAWTAMIDFASKMGAPDALLNEMCAMRSTNKNSPLEFLTSRTEQEVLACRGQIGALAIPYAGSKSHVAIEA